MVLTEEIKKLEAQGKAESGERIQARKGDASLMENKPNVSKRHARASVQNVVRRSTSSRLGVDRR